VVSRNNPVSVYDQSVEATLKNAQMEILAAARLYLPDFAQPFVVATINLVHSVDVLTDRIEEFFASLHINPPQEFMDVVRRVGRVTRPIQSVVEVEEVQVVDHMGGVVHHPGPSRPYDDTVQPVSAPTEDPFFRSRREIRAREGPGRRLRQLPSY